MKRHILLLSILGGFIVILSIVRIAVSNEFATDGIAFSSVEEQISTYQLENMVLREKLYSLSSLTHVAQIAKSQGFIEEKSLITIGQQVLPIALKQ